MHYRDFHQVPDGEVVRLLAEAATSGVPEGSK
jgi:predicted phosphoribosyltransferase